MFVVISGTPGTGKTVVGKKVAKLLNARLITTDYMVKKYKIPTALDKKRRTKIIDTQRLAAAAKTEAKKYKNSVFEGHLAHFAPSDITIILRTSPSALEKRLKKKGWNERKIRENVEAEAIGVISGEAKNAIEIDTTKKTPQENAEEILKIIKNKKAEKKKIDWSNAFEKYLLEKPVKR